MTVNRRRNSHDVVALILLFLFALLLATGCSSPPDSVPTAEADSAPPSSTNTAAAAAESTPVPPTAEPTLATTGQTTSGSNIPGRIAFISPSGQLGTVDPDGDDLRMLTASGIYQFPAWSPTTNQIAIIGTNDEDSGVFVTTDRDDNTLLPLYEQTNPIYLYWSPNGENVSFIAQHPDGLALHLAPADGTAESTVLSTGQPLYWQWFPDNQQALTHIGGEELATVDIEGNSSAIDLGQGGIFQAPALSPSGRLLAYSQGEDSNNLSIAIQDREMDEPLFEQPHAGILAMSWSPTAEQLAYISPTVNRAAFFGPLRLFDAESGESDVIVSTDVLIFFWSPDGRYIAYLTLRDNEGFQAQANKMRVSKPAQQDDSPPLFTLFIYDLVSGASRPLYTFQPTFLFVTQFMPFFDQYALSHRIWSPDSQHIVIPTLNEEEQNQIVTIPIDGSDPTIIADGISAFWSHQ